jgi:hypothetical protein
MRKGAWAAVQFSVLPRVESSCLNVSRDGALLGQATLALHRMTYQVASKIPCAQMDFTHTWMDHGGENPDNHGCLGEVSGAHSMPIAACGKTNHHTDSKLIARIRFQGTAHDGGTERQV